MILELFEQFNRALIRDVALLQFYTVQVVADACGAGHKFRAVVKDQWVAHVDDLLVVVNAVFEVVFDFSTEFGIEHAVGMIALRILNRDFCFLLIILHLEFNQVLLIVI